MNAILEDAARIISDRRALYGDPVASMANVAARWSVTLGQPVTPAEVILCMIDLKLTRLAHDPTHYDSIVDVIGYAALLPEVSR
jgi:hypothetical protein